MAMVSVYYLGLKAMFFFGLVRSFVVFEPLQKHWLFLALLYTAGVAFLFWVFFLAPMDVVPPKTWSEYQRWLVATGIISSIYFLLLRRFDEGAIFWILLLAGVGVVWY